MAGGALLLLAAEIWIPWAVARLWADPFLYYTWPVWRKVGFLLTPLGLAARFVDTLFHRLAGRPPSSADEESFEEEIRTMVSEGHREGLLEEDAREMIEGVIELSDVDVSQIMTPRTDMDLLPAAASWDEALQEVIKAGHTRMPVFGKNRDDIVGILYVKDLLPELAKPPQIGLSRGRSCCGSRCSCPRPSPWMPSCRSFSAGGTTWRWCWTSTAAFPAW